jgi:hypothetical protein
MIVKMKLKDRAPSPHPLPDGERAFRRDLAGDALERRVRKSHGGKGEG